MNATTLNMQVSAVQSSWNHRWQTALHHDLNEPILRSARKQLFRCRRKVLAGHSRIAARLGQFSWLLTILLCIARRAPGQRTCGASIHRQAMQLEQGLRGATATITASIGYSLPL